MANYNKQVEKWMSKATFDALDLSTIPEGTEINIVGDIELSDLSVDLQNKINGAGGGKLHLYALKIADPETNANAFYVVHIYSEKDGLTAETIANEIMIDAMGVYPQKMYNCIGYYVPSTGGTDYLIGVCNFTSLAISGNSLTGTVWVWGNKYETNTNTFTANFQSFRENVSITVEQLY